VFTRLTVTTARASGLPMPSPEHCPPTEAVRVARWLADRRAEGTPALLDAQAGLAVRVAMGARAEGLDVSGTLFRVGGEPLTAGKREVVESAGGTIISHYTMSETGRIAMACADPEAADDHHFLSDKLAVIQRDVAVGGDGAAVGALVYSTLLPSSPKLLINVESGDYGGLVERPCGCRFGELGLTTHVNDIHSYNKLTAEGNHFLGSDLLALVDQVLPARFGGGPTDYQLVEEEVNGLPKVTVVVRPVIGPVHEDEVIEAVLGHLGSKQRLRLMTEVWREGNTLRVARREPYRARPSGKILPLAVMDADRSAA
jgi:phenylacetate-coenzyme A ligase PaaK-like adenylate-forming protein